MVFMGMMNAFARFLKDQKSLCERTVEDYLKDVGLGCRESEGKILEWSEYVEFESWVLDFAGRTSFIDGRPKKAWSNLTTYGFVSSWVVFYGWAHKRKLIAHNPLKDGHDFEKGEGKCPEFFDWDSPEFKRVLYNPENSVKLNAILHILRSSGIRSKECCRLRIDDLKDRWLTIREGKGGRFRTALIDEEAAQWLQSYINGLRMQYDGVWMFPSREGRPMPQNTLYKALRGLGRRCGVHLYPHKMRHSLALEWLKRGGEIVGASNQLGHKDLRTTQRYTHLSDKFRKDEFERIFGKRKEA